MVAPPPPTRINLADAVDRYLDVQAARAAVGDLSPTTVDNYRIDLAEFLTHIGGGVVVDDIDGPMVDAAIAAYAAAPDRRYTDPGRKGAPGRATTTQVRYRRSIHRFFTHAQAHAWVQVSPMEWTTLRPRARGGLRAARTALTISQTQALLAHGAGDDPGVSARAHERNVERDRAVLAFLAVLGPRVSELCDADDTDFSRDGDTETWRIVGKGGKVRTLPLSPWLSQVKADYLAARPVPSPGTPATAATFRTGHGGRLAPRDVQRLLRRAYQRVLVADPAQAREVTPHALRHTAATLMLSKGWDVKVVAQMLGHASIATTGAYLDELPGELARAVADHPAASPADLPARGDVS